RERCPQGACHGNHRRARTGQARHLCRGRRLSGLQRRHGPRHRHPYRRRQGQCPLFAGRCRHRCRFGARDRVGGNPEQGTRRAARGRNGAGRPRQQRALTQTMNMRLQSGRFLAIALAYAITGKFGLLIADLSSHIALLWLPAGIAVAALFRWGYRCWLAILAGALLLNFSTYASLPAAAVITAGNVLGPLLAVWLLQHFHCRSRLERAYDVAVLALSGGLGMVLSASVGIFGLSLHSPIATEALGSAWFNWWMGDVMG